MKGLIEIFYEPGKVFDFVREHRAWVVAFLAVVIVGTAQFAYSSQQIGASNIARHQLEESKFAANMTPEQKEAAIAQADTPTRKVISICVAVVITSVIMLFFGVLFLAIAPVAGRPIKFPQAMGTASYAAWPITVIRAVFSVVVIAMAADKADLDPQHLLAFNIGAFLDKAATAKPLYALASAFDLLIFAQIFLAAYGLSRVAVISFTKALVGMFAIWAIFTVIAMGFSLIF